MRFDHSMQASPNPTMPSTFMGLAAARIERPAVERRRARSPSSYARYRTARAQRALAIGDLILAAFDAAAAALARALARYRQHRQVAAFCAELGELDDRMLHDLGFDRCEIRSIAAEIVAQAEPTRVRTAQTRARDAARAIAGR